MRTRNELLFNDLILQKSKISNNYDISVIAKVRSYLNRFSFFKDKELNLFRFTDMPRLYLTENINNVVDFNGDYSVLLEEVDSITSFGFRPVHCIWKCTEAIYYMDLQFHRPNEEDRVSMFVVIGDDLSVLEPFLKELAGVALREWEMEQAPVEGAMDCVFLSGEQLQDIKQEISDFLSSKDEYQKELKLPWKRGIVLYGPPGNGKTLLIRNIAKEFGLALADFKNAIDPHSGEINLSGLIHKRRSPLIDVYYPDKSKPVLIYLEDLDKIAPKFGRFDPENDIPAVSVSKLLNTIDGVNQISQGCIFIATVNNARDVSNALMDRPGRFDSLYEIELPDADTIISFWGYHNFKIGDSKKLDEEIQYEYATLFVKNKMSMAFAEEFVKACTMKYKTRDINSGQAEAVWEKLARHKKDYTDMFEGRSGLGFNKSHNAEVDEALPRRSRYGRNNY